MREWRFRYLKEVPPIVNFKIDHVTGEIPAPKATMLQDNIVEIVVLSDTYDRAHALADDIFYRRGKYGTKTGN